MTTTHHTFPNTYRSATLRLGTLVATGEWDVVATGKHRTTGETRALLLTPAP
ncbi:MAG: hypothetical protein M3P24_08790 [Gemmatimonadota bacterium]|nr:hypothetical protein [Gemmatimonadota bacterium]